MTQMREITEKTEQVLSWTRFFFPLIYFSTHIGVSCQILGTLWTIFEIESPGMETFDVLIEHC